MLSFIKKNTKTRFLFFLVADIFLISSSVILAFLIRFEGAIPGQYESFVIRMIGLTLLFTIPVFYFQKLYHFSWAYVSTSELISLFKASAASFIFLSVSLYLSFAYFPRSIILIAYFLIFLFCGGLRFAKRIFSTIFHGGKAEKRRTIIIGAGDAGEQILRNIINSKSKYLPIGFADDNPIKQGIMIHGLKVLGKIKDVPGIVEKYSVEAAIIAFPSAGSKSIREAVKISKESGLRRIKIIPPIAEIIGGNISLASLKDVDIEDLLGREKINLDTKEISSFIRNKTVLITGAAGSIGSELCRQVLQFKPSALLLLDQDETGIFNISRESEADFKVKPLIADICDKTKIEKIFREFKPNIVFHAAAYKHVPLMEENPEEAIKNNILGTRILAEAALENRAEKFIFISTDKSVNPTSVMGATKRAGEMICQAFNQKNGTKFISVRFGNVLNSRGSVIPIFREQIRNGGPVEVTHPDMKRYFMMISEACLLVMQAGAMGNGGEVFVLDMGKPIKILDLAKEMIRLSGREPDKDIPIVFIGVRPGEKLFEEMLTAEEGTIATQNQKIFIAKLSEIDSVELENKLKELKDGLSKEEILHWLEKIIPNYKSAKNVIE